MSTVQRKHEKNVKQAKYVALTPLLISFFAVLINFVVTLLVLWESASVCLP